MPAVFVRGKSVNTEEILFRYKNFLIRNATNWVINCFPVIEQSRNEQTYFAHAAGIHSPSLCDTSPEGRGRF